MCQECINTCEGISLSSNCVVWEGKKYDFSTFNSLIEFVVDTAKDYMLKPVVDLKTLSSVELNRDQILQLVVDKIVQIQHKETQNQTSSQLCNIDITPINDCNSCVESFCEKLQILINTVATLKQEINQLKSNVYN